MKEKKGKKCIPYAYSEQMRSFDYSITTFLTHVRYYQEYHIGWMVCKKTFFEIFKHCRVSQFHNLCRLFVSGLCTAGRLELNPRKKAVTKLAGEDKSFFISCIPISHTGPVSDSRIKAKELSWKKKQNPAIGNGWVTLGSVQHTR